MIKRMKNSDRGFYGYMGKIFGSRKVQRDTGDRFYDDDEKEWIMDIRNGSVASVISIKGFVIKNVYADDIFSLIDILKIIHPDVIGGIVPSAYREAYASADYKIVEEKKKFLEIKGGIFDERNDKNDD